jgi:hypothetical protein
MKISRLYMPFLIAVFFPVLATAGTTAVQDKVAVLITTWGMPAGYSFEYSWFSSQYSRCGDVTEQENQPCKFGHVGQLPYQAHFNMIPYVVCNKTPGFENSYDNSGIYILADGVYVSPNPDIPDVLPADIPAGVPVTPLSEMTDFSGAKPFAPDPRTGEDYLDGWYKIGANDNDSTRFANGFSDLAEQGTAYFTRYVGMIAGPTELPAAHQQDPFNKLMEDNTTQMLEAAFGENIDVRYGYYGEVPGYSKLAWDVAEEFANEGFTRMLLARETTDHNNYANHFFTGNYVRERLCEIGKLEDTEIFQSYQVGRTPEFNAMNVLNMKRFIEAYPEGSTIAIIYATRGLPWGQYENSGPYSTGHPWSKEVYFENAYLNYLSWKKAVQDAYGDKYTLVFTKGKVESNRREDNLFTFGLSTEPDLLGLAGEHVFYGIRDAIEFAVKDGIDKILVFPCHWNYDNFDTIFRMKELNNLPLTPKDDLRAGKYELTHCEDAAGNQVDCGSAESVAEITVGPSYSHLAKEFATAYYVMLRGALERFGLYPKDEKIIPAISRHVTKLEGGKLRALNPFNPVFRSSIAVPADPYPNKPEEFSHDNATAVNDPADTNECLWEDMKLSIAWRQNPPAMQAGVKAAGPAVHFGPYRTIFNRDVTVRIPYRFFAALGKEVQPYIYNHTTGQWDALQAEKVAGGMVEFKTQVLGLFRAGCAE